MAVLLFAGVLLGVGIHHVVSTGTCSSTGYTRYGPAPYCPAGTGWWIAFIVGGIFISLIGAGIAESGSGLVIPVIFSAIGAGSLTIAFDSSVRSGTKTFGIIFGGCFLAAGVIPALYMAVSGLNGLRSRPSPGSSFGTPSAAAPSSSAAASAFGTSSDATTAFGGSSKPDAIMGAYSGSAPTQPATPPSPRPSQTFTSPPPAGDALDKLAKLAALHSRGALTDDEFAREKAKLLGEI